MVATQGNDSDEPLPVRREEPVRRAAYSRAARATLVAAGLLALLFAFHTTAASAAGEATRPSVVAPAVVEAARSGPIRVIVQLDLPGTTAAFTGKIADLPARRQAVASARDSVVSALAGTDASVARTFDTVPFVALRVGANALAALERAPGVKRVILDELVSPNIYDSVSTIGAPAAWALGYTGEGQAVAILDTGVDASHPFMGGRVVEEACFASDGGCPDGTSEQYGRGAATPCRYGTPGCEHGTHVAGIAAGSDGSLSGVAPGARIVAVQVFHDTYDCGGAAGPCLRAYTSDYVRGLEWLLDVNHRVPVAAANLSLGGGIYFDAYSCDADNQATRAAIDTLRSVGIATVVAAGNEGFWGAMSSPACISSAVSVAATTRDGSSVTDFSNRAAFTTLAAPGESIHSSVPGGGFESMSGTSMAAPHITGAFAVLRQKNPSLALTTLIDALRSTATPIQDFWSGITVYLPQLDAALAAIPGSGGGTNPGRKSLIQISQAGDYVMIQKDIDGAAGKERWAVLYSPGARLFLGNVFKPGSDQPSFVYCQEIGWQSTPNEMAFECWGAGACASASCPEPGAWTQIASQSDPFRVPSSFFQP